MRTKEELIAYQEEKKLKQLTFNRGIHDDLYLYYGAKTLSDCMDTEECYKRYNSKIKNCLSKPMIDNYTDIEDSFIDRNGCSSGLW